MQVERPGYGGKAPNLLPDVSAGPMVSADDMGAANWRQVGQLSNAVGNLGLSVLDEYQKQKQREDKAFFDSRMANAQMQLLEGSKAIYEKHGEDALGAEKEMADLLARIKTDTAANLGTYEQKGMFNRSWQYFEDEAKQNALAHRQKEMAVFEQQAREAKMLSMTETAKATAAGDGGLDQVLRDNMAGHIEDEIRGANRGRPAEYVDHIVKAAVKSHHQELLKQFAARSPAVALEYLDSERVKGAFDLVEYKALRLEYTKAEIEAEQNAMISQGTLRMAELARTGGSPSTMYLELIAMVGKETADKVLSGYKSYAGLVESESKAAAEVEKSAREADEKARAERLERNDEILARSATSAGRDLKDASESDVREQAYANWPEKYADILVKAWKAEQDAVKADRAATASERDRLLLQALDEAGYDPNVVEKQMALTPDEKFYVYEKASKMRSLRPGEKREVDEALYLQYRFDTSDEELLDVFADPERRRQAAESLGGVNSAQYKAIESRVNALRSDREKQAAGGGGEAEKISTLDTDLNNVRREALATAANVGRTMSKDEQDEYLTHVVRYARKEYEASMARHKATDVKELPIEERNRIQADAVLTHKTEEWGIWPISGGGELITRAEAWSRGVDVSGAGVVPESLPPSIRANLTGAGELKLMPAAGGPGFVEVGIAKSAAPANIQAEMAKGGGNLSRNAVNGFWLLTQRDRAVEYSPNGNDSRIWDLKEVKNIAALIEADPYESLERDNAERHLSLQTDAAARSRSLWTEEE